MRIAIPTNDGVSISEHFGRSAAFLVFELENGQIKSRETRPNGGCHGHGSDGGDSHAGMVEVLSDCDVVISGGMGARIAGALNAAGIKTAIVAAAGPAETAMWSYLAGKLSPGAGCSCSCGH